MHLTEDQRSKLLKRNEILPTERRDNEFAVRNKLKEFLEFIPDANLIISTLPREQLRKNAKLIDILNDQTTYGVFDLVFQLLNLLDFPVAYGSLQKPYAIKESNYPGPYASKYKVPITIEEVRERERIEAKTYPKLKHMNPEDFERILYISEYIQALIDNYLSDLNLLDAMPIEIKADNVTLPDDESFVIFGTKKAGMARFNPRLIKAVKDFGPIQENDLMLKLFTDSSDGQKSKTFSAQLRALEVFGLILKDENGWRWATDDEQEELAKKKGIARSPTKRGGSEKNG